MGDFYRDSIVTGRMEFGTSTRGARILLYQGYRYTLNRRTADGHTPHVEHVLP